MGNLAGFMNTFGTEGNLAPVPEEAKEQPLASFEDIFGKTYESYWFYNKTIEIRFDKEEHQYFLVEEHGNLTPLPNVSSVSHIVDRSAALIPWASKMAIEKLLRTVPTYVDEHGCTLVTPMTFDEFSKIALEAKSAHRDKLEEAGEVGKDAHYWLEQYTKALISENTTEQNRLLLEKCKDERATSCVNAALGWISAHNVRFIASEKKVYSKIHKVSGTLDGLAWTDSCENTTCCVAPFKDHLSLIDYKTSNYLYTEFLYQTAAYQGFAEEEHPELKITDRWLLRLGKSDAKWDPWYLPSDTFGVDFKGFLACLELKRIVDKAEQRLKEQKQGVREAKKVSKELAKVKERIEEQLKKDEARALKKQEKDLAKTEAKAAKEKAKQEAKAAKLNAKLAPKSKTVDLSPEPAVEQASTPTFNIPTE